MSLESWLLVFDAITVAGTTLVVVGLVKEYGIEDLLQVARLRRQQFHPARIKVETWSERVGGVLVVIGIVVELLGTVAVVVSSLRIETEHRKEIVGLEQAIIALTPRNLTIDQEKTLFKLANSSKKLPAVLIWPQGDHEVNHIAGQLMMALLPWNLKNVNAGFMFPMIPGIQIQTSSGASKEQREAAKALAEELAKYLRNVSLSIDSRDTSATNNPQGKLEIEQGQFAITIGPLLWGSP